MERRVASSFSDSACGVWPGPLVLVREMFFRRGRCAMGRWGAIAKCLGKMKESSDYGWVLAGLSWLKLIGRGLRTFWGGSRLYIGGGGIVRR